MFQTECPLLCRISSRSFPAYKGVLLVQKYMAGALHSAAVDVLLSLALLPTRCYLSIRTFITFGQNKAWPEVAKAVFFFQINRLSFYILREDFTFTSSGTVNFTSMLAVFFSNRENSASSSTPPPAPLRNAWVGNVALHPVDTGPPVWHP